MSKKVTATTYLQIVPTFTWQGDNGTEERITGAKVVNATQNRPEAPRPGAIVVKIDVEVPARGFLPLSPSATVVVPESLVDQIGEVTAGVSDA